MGEKATNTTRDKVLVALALLALVGIGFVSFVMPKLQPEEPAPTTSAPAAEAPPVITPDTPAPAPTATEVYKGDDAEFAFEDSRGGFTATTDRKPQPGDGDKARAVLNAVLPRWAGIDLSGNGIAPDSWAKQVSRPGGVTANFGGWSQTRFYTLWSGVVQMRASAKVTGVSVDRELWNIGSHSMWRVSVTRSITANDTGNELMQETVSWDILVAQDDPDHKDSFVLDYFTNPDPADEKPETFYRPPLPQR